MTKTILTVDDSRTIRQMLRVALVQAGFDVVQAEDGIHGLEVLGGVLPDLIITDINMPRLGGFQLIEEVRHDAHHRAVPIFVLTTESDPEKKALAKRVGATGWIVKPFDPVRLVDVIRRVTPGGSS